MPIWPFWPVLATFSVHEISKDVGPFSPLRARARVYSSTSCPKTTPAGQIWGSRGGPDTLYKGIAVITAYLGPYSAQICLSSCQVPALVGTKVVQFSY